MKKIFETKIELPVKFSSGNQIEQGKGRIYRSKKYHTYHDYLKASLSGFAEGQPTSNLTLTAFLNKYSITPAQWLVKNKGMSIEDALYATPDEQETSGELQTEWSYKQGTHD